jgi:ELWxxDGT repeat protein
MTRRRTTWLVAALAFALPVPGFSQSAHLVRDIGQGPVFGQPEPQGTIAVGGRLYFSGYDYANQRELWTSDGTSAGTRIVIDGASEPAELLEMGGVVYFRAVDAARGYEIWRSDGTAAGTWPATDLDPSVQPIRLTRVGATLFFTAFGHATFGSELWKTDGTPAGTVLVRDIVPGIESSTPRDLVAAGGLLFFLATNPTTDALELWRSDGSPSGTIPLGSGVGAPESPRRLTAVGSTLFFQASDPVNGTELWKSDGTVAGTMLVTNIAPGAEGSFPDHLAAVGSTLYFAAGNLATGGELWKSDGTAAGTVLVSDAAPGSASTLPQDLVAVGSRVFYTAETPAAGRELWVSDGTAAGTHFIADLDPGGGSGILDVGVAFGGELFFVAFTPAEGRELWRSDGTAAGTRIVADLVPGDFSSTPRALAVSGAHLYFSATTANERVPLWHTDGTAAGTVEVGPAPPVSGQASIDYVGPAGPGLAFRVDSDPSLWLSRGSEATTVRVTAPPAPCLPQLLGDRRFVVGHDAAFGSELWSTSGTVDGTCRVTDLAPGPASADIRFVGEVGDRVFFQDVTPLAGARLWVVSAAATTAALAATGRRVESGVAFKGELFFTGGGSDGLWRSDGTASGTLQVASVRPRSFMVTPSLLYFVADTGLGQELWKSDGTPAGTSQVADICPGTCGAFDLFTSADVADHAAIGDVLYFTANDGTHGIEVWRTDGTAAGTTMVADVSPSPFSYQGCLAELNGLLLFCGDDGVNGREVWRSDGTTVGTFRVTDLDPGVGHGVAQPARGSFQRAGDRIVFPGYTRALGIEPWSTDGTPSGTALVHDIQPGPGSSAQFLSTMAAGPHVYMTADDGVHGRELWAADLEPALSIEGATVVEGDAGTTTVLVEVRATGAPASMATVAYATADGTAQAGTDYVATSGTLTFHPSSTTTLTIAVPVSGDLAQEGDETFAVTLSSASGIGIGHDEGIVLIRDDDGPRVAIADGSVAEGDAGDAQAQFQVRITTEDGAATSAPTSVGFVTSDGTASSVSDYQEASGTVTFPAGSPSGSALTLTVAVHGDTLDESDETFRVRLTPLSLVTVAGAATGRIADDDGAADAAPLGLVHGSARTTDLSAQPGPVADTDWYTLVSDDPSSYEVVVDGVSGDLQPLSVDLMAEAGTVPSASATAVGTGGAQSLRFSSASPFQRIRVRSGGCGTGCAAHDTYRIRAYDTSYAVPRVVTSDSLSSAVIVQNRQDGLVRVTVWFWRADGVLDTSRTVMLPPRSSGVVAVPPDVSGSATVTHDGGYGALAGKAVTVDLVTGASYDTPMEPRRR